MAYQNKPKGKTYPLLPCIDCGGDVAIPSKPYYPPKARCDPCDKKHRNRKKTLRKQRDKPTTYCERCQTPFPHGTHLGKKVCDECTTIREAEVRANRVAARLEKLKGHHCVDCAEPLHLDIEFLNNPTSRGQPTKRCPTCMKKHRNKGKAHKIYRTDMGSAFRQIKKKCKTKNLPFDLTLDSLVVPEDCPVFKKPRIHRWREPYDAVRRPPYT